MKRKTISKRLTIQVMGLVLSFSIVLLIANSLLLKPLYYYSVKTAMLSGMEQLSEVPFMQGQWQAVVETIDPEHGYDITVEKSGQVVYSSSREIGVKEPGDFEPKSPPDEKRPFLPIDLVKTWTWEGDVQMGTLQDDKKDMHLFIAKKQMDEDTIIYLTQGIEPILSSVRQANVLLISVTFLFLIITVFAVMIVSKRFTQPIRAMQEHVKELANLNFDEQIQVSTGDELEHLSGDIQRLAVKLKEALQVLQKQNIQLEKDIESQRKFISNASHELRTPLALIKGYADEIAQGYVKDQEQEKIYIRYIADESNKMKRLLNEILELSRIESGYMQFHYEEVSIKESIEGFIEKYQGFIEENQLKISLELIEGTGIIDTVRFEQVLANYLSNAAKYAKTSKQIHICMEEHAKTYRIKVINFGTPIPTKTVQHMWDGFYKEDEARATHKSSYGLGLSVVRAIQDVAGQAYGYDNEKNQVVFWFDVAKTLAAQ